MFSNVGREGRRTNLGKGLVSLADWKFEYVVVFMARKYWIRLCLTHRIKHDTIV